LEGFTQLEYNNLVDRLSVADSTRNLPISAAHNQLIRKLGIWDSRLHLVGMHEAVWEMNSEDERKLFEEVIPSIPRMVIPRWKRLIYEPQA
jgi:hypothetical protein